MNFGDALKTGLEIIKLDEPSMTKASKDESGLQNGLIIIAIGGFLGALGTYIQFQFFPDTLPESFLALGEVVTLSSLFVGPIWSMVGALVSVGLFHLMARLLKGKSLFLPLFQAAAFASLLSWVGVFTFIPRFGTLLTIVISMWSIVVLILIIRKIHQLSTLRAISSVLIPVLVFFLILLGFIGVTALLGV